MLCMWKLIMINPSFKRQRIQGTLFNNLSNM
jgi:hypothetical protein